MQSQGGAGARIHIHCVSLEVLGYFCLFELDVSQRQLLGKTDTAVTFAYLKEPLLPFLPLERTQKIP